MEYLEGTSLDRLIATAPLGLSQAIDIGIQVAAGFQPRTHRESRYLRARASDSRADEILTIL